MEDQDPRGKRKLQNRMAQRRFRSRKKGSETVILHADQKVTESASWSSTQAPWADSYDQSNALTGAAQSDFQSYGGDNELSRMLAVDTPEDVFPSSSGAFVSKPWSRPPQILSPPSEDTHPVNGWKGYDSLETLLNAAEDFGMGPIFQQRSNTGDTFTLAECLESPGTIYVVGKPSLSARPIAGAASVYTVTGCSPAARSALAINDHYSEHPFPVNANKKSRNKRKSLGANISKSRVECCVLHRAESMISELQKLYNYGVHFGFFETEDDEVLHCLSFLKAKLKDMAQCAGGVAGFSSSSDSDVE